MATQLDRMLQLITKASLLHGLRLAASVCLALFIAFSLELDTPSWAGSSAALVCLPSLGASLRKGRFRAVGTLVGAIAIVVLTSAFPQDRVGLLGSLALWCGVCSFLSTVLRNNTAYAAALAGYTAAIVFSDAVNAPPDTFMIAVTRATEICIGIGSAGLILIFTDLGAGRRRLAQAIADTGQAIAIGLAATLATGFETLEMRSQRRELIRRVIELETTVDEVIGEASDLRGRASALRAAGEGLISALSAWRAIGNHLTTTPQGDGAEIARGLVPAVSRIGDGNWTGGSEGVRDLCQAERLQLLSTPVSTLSGRILFDAVAEALHGLARATNVIVLISNTGRAQPDRAGTHPAVPDLLPALINALRTVVAVLAAETLWIATGWPNGQSVITFTAIGVMLFAPLAERAYSSALQFVVGTVIAACLATVVDFAVLPGKTSFLGLALVIAVVMVPVAVLSVGSWRKPLFFSMVANLIPLLSPANPQTYDAAGYFNATLAIVVGVVASAIFLQLIPSISPVHRIGRLQVLAVRDLRRLAIDRLRLDRRAWTMRLSHRLGALPPQATLDEAAQMVAVLSVGEAVIDLHGSSPSLGVRGDLDRGMACLAAGDFAGARTEFADFSARPPDSDAAEGVGAMRARASAAVIVEALTRHSRFFASAAFHKRRETGSMSTEIGSP